MKVTKLRIARREAAPTSFTCCHPTLASWTCFRKERDFEQDLEWYGTISGSVKKESCEMADCVRVPLSPCLPWRKACLFMLSCTCCIDMLWAAVRASDPTRPLCLSARAPPLSTALHLPLLLFLGPGVVLGDRLMDRRRCCVCRSQRPELDKSWSEGDGAWGCFVTARTPQQQRTDNTHQQTTQTTQTDRKTKTKK